MSPKDIRNLIHDLEAEIDQAVEAERMSCSLVAEAYAQRSGNLIERVAAINIARLIRNRSNK
jgi:hypothetical protein